jgi:hypothetical protein
MGRGCAFPSCGKSGPLMKLFPALAKYPQRIEAKMAIAAPNPAAAAREDEADMLQCFPPRMQHETVQFAHHGQVPPLHQFHRDPIVL